MVQAGTDGGGKDTEISESRKRESADEGREAHVSIAEHDHGLCTHAL